MPAAETLLVGAGPVGCLLASALLQKGLHFDWYIRRNEVRDMARSISLRFPDHRLALDSSLIEFPDTITSDKHNTVITCVKSQQTERLLASLPGTSTCRRLAVANGLISGDHHLGLLYGGAFLDRNELVTRRSNTLRIGSLGSIVDDSEFFCKLLECDWLKTESHTDIELLQWHKLCLNCLLNPLTALLDLPNGRMTASLESPLLLGMAAELQLVAKRHLGKRWRYSKADILQGVSELIEATVDNSSSMREDLRQGRQPEISHMNGAIARLGREYNIPCPLNNSVAELVIAVSDMSHKAG